MAVDCVETLPETPDAIDALKKVIFVVIAIFLVVTFDYAVC